MSDAPRTRPAGEIVGSKYRLVRFLAAGGMGSVYEAHHTVVKRRFAVKFLRADLAVERASLARFQREAQAAGALESEHVAAAVDFGIASDGSPFIVMEYLTGESLAALLEREGRLAPGRAADLVMQACRGVEAAHAAGIVHRDLKPQNLFVARREDGTDLVKVLDFGVAKLEAEDQGAGTTRTGTVLGTPAYMSPEQARGDKVVDHRSDVYSLGAILYELLSGQKPHPGDSPNAVLYHIATHPPLPLAGATSELPPALVESVERALAQAPDDRQASASALSAELAPFAVRQVHPKAKTEPSAPVNTGESSTVLASGAAPSLAVSAVDTAPAAASEKTGRGAVNAVVWGVLGAAVAVALGWAGRLGSDSNGTRPPDARDAAPAAAGSASVPPETTKADRGVSPIAPPPTPGPGTAVSPPPSSSIGRPLGRPPGRPTPPAGEPRTTGSNIAGTPATASAPIRFDQRNPYE